MKTGNNFCIQKKLIVRVHGFELHESNSTFQTDRQTDRRTDDILIAIPPIRTEVLRAITSGSGLTFAVKPQI